jgi:hypothetical protein
MRVSVQKNDTGGTVLYARAVGDGMVGDSRILVPGSDDQDQAPIFGVAADVWRELSVGGYDVTERADGDSVVSPIDVFGG